MEIRLREGDGLQCEVAGTNEKALIKLQTEKGETPWMGIEALKKAYRILAPIAGETLDLQQYPKKYPTRQAEAEPEFAQQPKAIPSPPPPAASKKLSDNDIRNLTQFQSELVELIANPPAMNDGPVDGLSEAHIRRLISNHQGRFQDPFTLYPILQKHLGMGRERFEAAVKASAAGLS